MSGPEYRGMTTKAEKRRFENAAHHESTREERDAYALLRQRFQPTSSQRCALERRWHHNLAFISGNQWHTFDTERWAMVAPGSRQRLREMRNYIRPHHLRSISHMTGFNPKWVVIPNSQDVEDVQAARAGTNILDHQYRHLGFPKIWRQNCSWTDATGTGFIKTAWNHFAGRRYQGPAVDYNGNLLLDEEGVPYEEDYYEGDIMSYAVSPFNMHVDPLATCDDDVEWMMEVSRRPLTWVDRYFPEKSSFVSTDHSADVNDPLRRHRGGLSVLNSGLWGSVSEQETAHDWVTLYEYYERPSPMYPKGRLIIGANNVILQMGDNPTPDRGFPYATSRKTEVPGSFWGQSEIDDLITPQINYNRLVTKRLEHVFLFGMNMKVLYQGMGGNPQASFQSGLGEVLKYNGTIPPQYMQPPPLPPESEQEMLRFRGDFDAITSTYGAEKGQYQGKQSGNAIQLQVEQGFKTREPMLRRLADALQRWGKLVLMNFQEFAEDEHVIKVQGKDSQYDVQAFRGADLRDNTDVYVDIDSMRPKSRTMAMQDVATMYQVGLFEPGNPKDKANAFKHIDMAHNIEDITYDHERDRRIAQMEDAMLLEGKMVKPPEPTDDHDIHEEQHRSTMNSDRWRTLSPEEQEPMRQHYQQHLDAAKPQPGVTLPPHQQAELASTGEME